MLVADECFVHFHNAAVIAKINAVVAAHGLADAVRHKPCGFIGDFQNAVKLVTADALLAGHRRCCMDQTIVARTLNISETPMAKVGYARVSSVGQSLDVQREKLGGCDKLFEEKRSGTTDARPMLKQCLGYVREGDQLIVTRIDRLARSTLHLCQIAETLRKKGVDLVVLDQNIDTSSTSGVFRPPRSNTPDAPLSKARFHWWIMIG